MVRWVVGSILHGGARCISVVRAFAHGAMGRRIGNKGIEGLCFPNEKIQPFPPYSEFLK